MLRLLTWSIIGVLAALALTFTAAAPAHAGTGCAQVDRSTGQCVITAHAPGTSASPSHPSRPVGPKDTGSGQACYWDPSKQGVTGSKAGPVACTSPYGYWSNTYNCYIQLQKPQPPAGDPSWKGHKPGDGAIYSCYQPQTTMLVSIWANATPSQARRGPTPRQVAEAAVKQMNLTAVQIGIAPKPGPNSVGLVGMPVWMWAANPDVHSIGPMTASASAGGITITATAKLLHVTWNMGDGSQVVCKTAGTPYTPEYGRKESPDCGYTYTLSSARDPGQAYTVTATSSWVITWAGAGQTGTIRLDGLTRSAQIRIGEAQVLVD